MGLVGASHDQHIGRILRKEDEARGTETMRTTELVHGFTSGKNTTRIFFFLKYDDILLFVF